MGYELGALKYFLGMMTSVWGVITAYLFAKGLLQPLDYVEGFLAVVGNLDNPTEALVALIEIFITTPQDFAEMALIGLTIMTLSWYIAVKS